MYDYLPKRQEMGGCPCGLTSSGPGEVGVADTGRGGSLWARQLHAMSAISRWAARSNSACPGTPHFLPGRGASSAALSTAVETWPRLPPQGPRARVPHDRIALARQRFQAPAIDNREVALGILQHPHSVEVLRRERDALTACAHHLGEDLVGEAEFIRWHPIVEAQQPPAQARHDRVAPIAHRDLSELRQQGLCIAEQCLPKGTA